MNEFLEKIDKIEADFALYCEISQAALNNERELSRLLLGENKNLREKIARLERKTFN